MFGNYKPHCCRPVTIEEKAWRCSTPGDRMSMDRLLRVFSESEPQPYPAIVVELYWP